MRRRCVSDNDEAGKPKGRVREEAPLCADCKRLEAQMGTSAAEMGDFVRRIVDRELQRAVGVAKAGRKNVRTKDEGVSRQSLATDLPASIETARRRQEGTRRASGHSEAGGCRLPEKQTAAEDRAEGTSAASTRTERGQFNKDAMRQSCRPASDLQAPLRDRGRRTETGRRGSDWLRGNAPKEDRGLCVCRDQEKSNMALRRPRGRGLP